MSEELTFVVAVSLSILLAPVLIPVVIFYYLIFVRGT